MLAGTNNANPINIIRKAPYKVATENAQTTAIVRKKKNKLGHNFHLLCAILLWMRSAEIFYKMGSTNKLFLKTFLSLFTDNAFILKNGISPT